jgi:hypothetical protein
VRGPHTPNSGRLHLHANRKDLRQFDACSAVGFAVGHVKQDAVTATLVDRDRDRYQLLELGRECAAFFEASSIRLWNASNACGAAFASELKRVFMALRRSVAASLLIDAPFVAGCYAIPRSTWVSISSLTRLAFSICTMWPAPSSTSILALGGAAA